MSPLPTQLALRIEGRAETRRAARPATHCASRALERAPGRRAHAQRGATAIEFALVFPLFFSILYAIVMFSLILVAQQNLTLAASEGARSALNWRANGGLTDAIQKRTDGTCTTAKLMISTLVKKMDCTATQATCNGGMVCVTVTLKYDYSTYPVIPTLPLLSYAVPTSLTSTAMVQLNPENVQ
jgi:Flp pilus assembly protein TadG